MPLPVEGFQIREIQPRNIGTRKEPFVDGDLIDILRGDAQLVLHRPIPRELVLIHDAPWEGNTCGYHTIFYDPDGPGKPYRMTYRGSHGDPTTGASLHPQVTCYAESDDGIHWIKPQLGLFPFAGTKANNIIWQGTGCHNFTPFKDTSPHCPAQARYKALGGTREEGGLYAFQSPDGIHWSLMQPEPVITAGTFDSQNLAFWDIVHGLYRAYIRDFRGLGDADQPYQGWRDIKTCTSPDFIHWSQPRWLRYVKVKAGPGADQKPPDIHLYTNQIRPYPGAPHLYIGFPTRFLPDRGSLTEGLLMVSRDGHTFARWEEAFLPPGPSPERWHNRSNYVWNGLVLTEEDLPGAPQVFTLYSNEHYYQAGGTRIRRYTLRQDGFVSVRAGAAGGEMVTWPLTFAGRYLTLNAATAAGGQIQVEIQRLNGQPVAGFGLGDNIPFYGDSLGAVVQWQQGKDISSLAGQVLRLRFVLRDADLYALQFTEDVSGR